MGSASNRIELKSEKDLNHMRRAGRLTAQVMREVAALIAPGVSTKELDQRAEKIIRAAGARPTFLGYRGYPATLCTSINEEVVHGIPHSKRFLKEGDILSVDVGVTYEGFVGDMAWTFPVNKIGGQEERLLRVTRGCLEKGIEKMRPGNRLGDVSSAIQQEAESQGFQVVREFVGHGIGREMHEAPSVPNYGEAHTGIRLDAGVVLALEPMVTVGDWRVRVLGDRWTVVTADGSLSAHFEHTVAVTPSGPEILTKLPDDEIGEKA